MVIPIIVSWIAPSVAGCTLTQLAQTHPFAQPEAGLNIPIEPSIKVDHNKDEMNRTNKKLNHI